MSNLTHKYLNFSFFSRKLLKWNKEHNFRTMPWKGEKDAYKIWLSEIILQQTRVEQGLEYYNKFITTFPTIKHLALAKEQQVFKLWEGLGYYSRCRNLIATAQYIYKEQNGVFPNSYEAILNLKGIGPYTASAIASFAYNLPYAVVDGNVYRVLARVFGITDSIDSNVGKKKFAALAFDLMDKKKPGVYNQAIMDFGATVCKPITPKCTSCCFNIECVAFKENSITTLPVKEKKIKKKQRFFYFFLIQHKQQIALRERKEKDIWRHLYEFPLIELSKENCIDEAMNDAIKNDWLPNNATIKNISNIYKQTLTHQNIKAVFINININKKPAVLNEYEWPHINKLEQYSFPQIINSFIKEEGIK